MTHAEVQHLITRYLAAETTADEERKLEDFFRRTSDIPPEWRAVAIMLRGSAAKVSQRLPQPPDALPLSAPRPSRMPAPWRAVAAAAIVLLAAMPVWWLLSRQPQPQQTAMQPEVATEKTEISTEKPMAHLQKKAEPAAQPRHGQTETAESKVEKPANPSVKSTARPQEKPADATADTPPTVPETVPTPPKDGAAEKARRLVEQELQENLLRRRVVEDVMTNMLNQPSINYYTT